MNTQDFAPTTKTPAQRLANVRSAAQVAACMIRIWGTGTEAQRAAMAALELVELEVQVAMRSYLESSGGLCEHCQADLGDGHNDDCPALVALLSQLEPPESRQTATDGQDGAKRASS